MPVKMIVVDLDGTLLTSSEQVTQASADAFADIRKRGVLPVVATGRMYHEARFAIEAIGADTLFVGMNGAQMLDLKTGECIHSHVLEQNTAHAVVRMLDELDVFYQVYTQESVYARQYWIDNMTEAGVKKEYIRQFGKSVRPYTDIADLVPVKMFVVTRDKDKQHLLRERIAALNGVVIVGSYANSFEILPEGLNKGDALLRLCAHTGISPSDVAAIGDSENDIEMLTQAGVSIAMGNAFERVKAVADHIAPSHNDEGVAFALTSILPDYL